MIGNYPIWLLNGYETGWMSFFRMKSTHRWTHSGLFITGSRMNFNWDVGVSRDKYQPGIFWKEGNAGGLDTARPGGEKRTASWLGL